MQHIKLLGNNYLKKVTLLIVIIKYYISQTKTTIMKKFLVIACSGLICLSSSKTTFAQIYSQTNAVINLSGNVPSSKWVNAGVPLIQGYGEQVSGNADQILAMASTLPVARPVILGRRSKGTLASPTVVAANDYITSFLASGYDGTNFQNAAAIDFFVDGTPTAGNVPIRLSLVTGSNGSNRTERLKVGNTGDFTFNTNQMFLQRSTGRLGLGTLTPGGQLELSLDQGRKPATSTWTITSDARLKNIIGKYNKGLSEIIQLQPITYYYKNNKDRTFDEKVLSAQAYGFSAQDVQKLFPEAVSTDEDGYLSLNIHPILIAAINAIKELNMQKGDVSDKNETITKMQLQIDKQQQQIDMLIQKLNELSKTQPCAPVASK